MEKLKKLKEDIENIEISYDYEKTYCELRNATIDYQNDTQDFIFDYTFDEYVDDEILEQLVEYNLTEHGIWAVRNLLSDINYLDDNVYKVDAYGYGHNIDIDDLKSLKENIIFEIDHRLKEEK